MLRIHGGSVSDYPRSCTRSAEWMTSRCVSDEIHSLLRRCPEFCQPLRTPSGTVPSSAERSDSANPSASYPACPAMERPSTSKSAIRVRGLAAGEIPKGAVQQVKYLVQQVRQHGTELVGDLGTRFPSLHRRQLVLDRSCLTANVAAWACLPVLPL